jgi:hypothetical protein
MNNQIQLIAKLKKQPRQGAAGQTAFDLLKKQAEDLYKTFEVGGKDVVRATGFGLVAEAAVNAYEKINVLEKQNRKLSEAFGVNTLRAAQLSKSFDKLGASVGVNTDKLKTYAGELKKLFPGQATYLANAGKFGKDIAKQLDLMRNKMGLSAEVTEGYIRNQTLLSSTSANNFEAVVQKSSAIMQIAAKALSDATNSATGLTTEISDLISSLKNTTNNLQNYTANLDTVGKALIYNSKQVQILIESNEEKMIEVLNSILDNSRKIFTSTQSLNQNITQVTTSLKDHIVQIDQQSKFLYNLTVTIQKADGNINQVSGKLEENTPLLDNQINKLQLLTSQLNQTTQVVYQVNGNLAGLLNASQKSQQSNN